MTVFQICLGWTFIICGLCFSGILFLFAVRKYRKETKHSFSFRDLMLGKNRMSLEEPAIQTFIEAVLGLLGVVVLYYLLFRL